MNEKNNDDNVDVDTIDISKLEEYTSASIFLTPEMNSDAECIMKKYSFKKNKVLFNALKIGLEYMKKAEQVNE